MGSRAERLLWTAVTMVLLVFAIPWFLWGDARVLAGLPVWLWWHIGWLCLAAAVFYVFVTRSWGLGITDGEAA